MAGMGGKRTLAASSLLEASRAWAYFEKRNYVIPDDIQAVFPYVAGHRMFSGHSLPTELEKTRAKEFISSVPFVKEK